MEPTDPTSFADGRYVVERRLGGGGMGSVWLARDTRLGDRLVAVKVLGGPGGAASLPRFRREARLLARLAHPNLVAVFDVDTAADPPYIVQEYVEGEDLETRLDRCGTLEPLLARRLLGELADALAFLHDQGVVHRDIKPANVMIDRDGRFRLMDFGLATEPEASRITGEDTVVGTPACMPPNVISGDEHGPADDVYQVGLLVHLAATGVDLHGDVEDFPSFLRAVIGGTFRRTPIDPGLATDLAAIVELCCRDAPGDRPADGRALRVLVRGEDAGEPGGRVTPRREKKARGERYRGPSVASSATIPAFRPRGPWFLVLLAKTGAAILLLGLGYLALAVVVDTLRSPAPDPPLLTTLPPGVPPDDFDDAPAETTPADGPSLPGIPRPRVRWGLDAVGFAWRQPPSGELTVNLRVGDTVTTGTVRNGRCVVGLPTGVRGPVNVTWELLRDGVMADRGSGTAGLVRRFDPASVPGLDAREARLLLPALVTGGDRLVLALRHDALLCLRPAPRGAPRLDVDWLVGLPSRPLPAVADLDEAPPRLRHPVAAMVEAPGGRVLSVLRGLPGALLARSPAARAAAWAAPLTTSSAEATAALTRPDVDRGSGEFLADLPGEEFVDALLARLPGGGTACAVESIRHGASGPGLRRVIVTLTPSKGGGPPATGILPGRTPLVLEPLGDDDLALGWVADGERPTLLILHRERNRLVPRTRIPLPLAVPAWRDEAGLVSTSLPALGRAVLAVGSTAFIVDASPPAIRSLPLPLPGVSRLVGLVPGTGASTILAAVQAWPPPLSVSARVVLVDLPTALDGPTPTAVPVDLILASQFRHSWPAGFLRAGGRLHLFVGHRVIVAEDAPPFKVTATYEHTSAWSGSTVLLRSVVCHVTRSGEILGYDLTDAP